MKKLILSFVLVASSFYAFAQAPVSDGERKRIEQIVRDYILNNPEILNEALSNLEKKQAEQEEKSRLETIAKSRELIYRSPTSVVLNNPKGEITLVEFFDYNCGYCKKAFNDVQALVKEDKSIRFVLKDFPVLGQGSVEAARVAVALKMQVTPEQFFKFHSKLMTSSGQANFDKAYAVAKEVGADMKRLDADMQSSKTLEILKENLALADNLKITGTPSYVLGDDVMVGALSLAALKLKVEGAKKICADKAKC